MANHIGNEDLFRLSYQQQDTYPQNLLFKGTYRAALKQASDRLSSASERTFTAVSDEIDVPFRDLDQDGNVVKYRVFESDEKLKEHIGDLSSIDPLDNSRLLGDIITKVDPQCRFIFLSGGQHSRRCLGITKKMFTRLMTYHQVLPAYIDLVTMFGFHEDARDLRFSKFSEQSSITPSINSPCLASAGRSGRFYQICFNLKAPATSKATANVTPWTIRQTAVHHYFDVINGRMCWTITKGNWLLKERIEDLTSRKALQEGKMLKTPIACFLTSLEVVLLLCHWSTEGWKDYLERYEDLIDAETDLAIRGVVGTMSSHLYNLEHVQVVQGYQDKMNEATMVIKLNIRILDSICTFYEKLVQDSSFPLVSVECTDHVNIFVNQLKDMKHDLESHISRSELLVQIIADRKDMIVHHLQAQTTTTMEGLTKSMHQIGIISQTEAIAMRIITVVTLIYLPATFVSTFFSTDVVKYQNQNGDTNTGSGDGTSFSLIAFERWMEVTLPLTLLTLLAAFYTFRRSMKSRLRTLGLNTSVAKPPQYVARTPRKKPRRSNLLSTFISRKLRLQSNDDRV